MMKEKQSQTASVSLLFPVTEDGTAAAARLGRAIDSSAVGDRLSLVAEGAGFGQRISHLLSDASLLLEQAEAIAGVGVRVTGIVAPGLLTVRPLGLDGLDDILALARRVYFLPKKTWKTGHVEMIEDGLRKGVWRAIGLFDGARLASYLDCRDHEDGSIEIGFSMTDPDYRRRGLQKRLIGDLVLSHFDRQCDISSSEGNPTLKVLTTAGFAVTRRCPGERLDGSTSIYLSRPAWYPLHLNWPCPLASQSARSLVELA